MNLTFYNEDSGMCVDITIINDTSLERSESFYLTLTRTEGLNERIQFTADKAKITINENNGNYCKIVFGIKLVLISLFSRHNYSRSGQDLHRFYHIGGIKLYHHTNFHI